MKKTLAVSSYLALLLSLLFSALAGYAGAPSLHAAFSSLSLFAGLYTAAILFRCAAPYAEA